MKKDVNFKTNINVYNIVHTSGYKINHEERLNIEGKTIRHSTIEAIDKRNFIFKKINIANFYIEVEENKRIFRGPPKYFENENDYFHSEEFIKIVNKYGLLSATHKFVSSMHSIDGVQEMIYTNFAESYPSDISSDLSIDRLNKELICSELLAEWKILFGEGKKKNNEATWSVQDYFLNKFFNKNVLYIDQEKNEMKIFHTCLGGALAVYKYSKNDPELQTCKFCGSNFVDSSKGNIQKFCSESCRAKHYRQKKLNSEIEDLTKKYGDNFDFSSMKYLDIIRRSTRFICKNCGKKYLKNKSDFQSNPTCSICNHNISD